MFNAYEFTFAGESSLMRGLMLYDIGGNRQESVSFGNGASITEMRMGGRIQPIHFGVDYHAKPLEFKLVFGSDRPMDRFEMESVAMWLTGYQDYQWLSIEQGDLGHVQFRCLITSLTPIHHGWLPVAFEAKVRCDCPYAYSYPFEKQYQIKGETQVLFGNNSTVREFIKPALAIYPAPGVEEVKIVNKSDGGRTFLLSKLPADALHISVDNNCGVLQELNHGYNLYDNFNLNFFRLVPGDNELELTGDGVVTVSGRFLYNMAG